MTGMELSGGTGLASVPTHIEPAGVTHMTADQIELVKRTIADGATDDELALFIGVCERTGLDPFARQIYAIRRWDNQKKREVMGIQTSIDGFRLIAQRTREYSGQEGPFWCGQDGVWTDVWLRSEPPAAAKVGVCRKSFDKTLFRVVHWNEYVQTKRDGQPTKMWAQMPAVMLSKCAEAAALRAAFPAELSGLYTSEEMGVANMEEPSPDVDPETGEVAVGAWEKLGPALELFEQLPQSFKTKINKWMSSFDIDGATSPDLLEHGHPDWLVAKVTAQVGKAWTASESERSEMEVDGAPFEEAVIVEDGNETPSEASIKADQIIADMEAEENGVPASPEVLTPDDIQSPTEQTATPLAGKYGPGSAEGWPADPNEL